MSWLRFGAGFAAGALATLTALYLGIYLTALQAQEEAPE